MIDFVKSSAARLILDLRRRIFRGFYFVFSVKIILMNRNLLLGLTLLSSFSLSAQITITNADMVSGGDSVRVSYSGNGTANVDHTLSGANYLWDFSGLQPLAQEMLRYDVPTAIPFNFLATVAVVNPSPDSLPVIGSVPSNFTDYYKGGSSGYRQVGISFEYAPLGNFSVPVIFSSNDYIYRFPLDYGDLDTSDGAYSFNIPNLLFFGQDIHRESNVDGWGTLITPYGTFQALRVVSHVQRVDTIGIDSVNGFSSARPLEVQYKWLAAGMKIPVLEVDAQVILNNEVVTNVTYQDSLRDSVFQVGLAEPLRPAISQVFPNPASSSFYVSCTLPQPGTVRMEIFDMSGRPVLDLGAEERSSGYFVKELDASSLSAGTYMLRMNCNGQYGFSTLIIVK